MSAYAIFDVEIRDPVKYQEYMVKVAPALKEAGAKYLVRGGRFKVYEGDWMPRRLVIVEFPSMDAAAAFYNSPLYQGLKDLRESCSSGRLVGVEGIT